LAADCCRLYNTMLCRIPIPPTNDLPTLRDRIVVRHPQAEDALKQIELFTNDLPFGTPINRILNDYHFASVASVANFFRVYLGLRHGEAINNDIITTYLVNTINRLPVEYVNDSGTNQRAFQQIFDTLLVRINSNSAAHRPTVNFLVGPTGAGKTIFSKSLFTVCTRNFWENKIIPCRVEYSRYAAHQNRHLTIDQGFFLHLRLCQFRDFIIYLFGSGLVDPQTQHTLLDGARLESKPYAALKELQRLTKGLVIDGQDFVLDSNRRALFHNACRPISDEDKLSFLYHASSQLRLRFAISFDGFDFTRIEHFLFDNAAPLPIAPLVSLLKGLHEKTGHIQPKEQYTDNHYLLYLRDTTFERLRTEIVRGVGGKVDYPIYWIVPPKYELLIGNAARAMTKSDDPAVHKAGIFADDLFAAFNKYIFEGGRMTAEAHMSFLFGSNARDMKRHIKQLLTSALHRGGDSGFYDFYRESSGIDAKSVWIGLVSSHTVRDLPRYLIFEDLFLHETRQLFPKLRLDPQLVDKYLTDADFSGLMSHIQDRDETTGIFGCLFNYFYCFELAYGSDRQPGLLILIRILQYVEKNRRCTAGDVEEFVQQIGYRLPEAAFQFVLFVLIRTELLKWDGSSDARHINDVPLYLSAKGAIAINKLLFSITYISEGLCASLLLDRELSKLLRGRQQENAAWIADCVNNACVALYLIDKIEQIEAQWAAKNQLNNFGAYRISNNLRAYVERESANILSRPHPLTISRWHENRSRLRDARRRYPTLVIFGDN
jgi:hypothetical protein